MKSDNDYKVCQITALNESRNFATIRIVKYGKSSSQGTLVKNLYLLYRNTDLGLDAKAPQQVDTNTQS